MIDLSTRSTADLNILVFGAEPDVATAAMDELHGRALDDDYVHTHLPHLAD